MSNQGKLYTFVQSGNRRRYCVRIHMNGKQRTIGWTDTEADAKILAAAARNLRDVKQAIQNKE